MAATYPKSFTLIKPKLKYSAQKIATFIDRRPLLSFFGLLIILFLLILLGNLLRQPPEVPQAAATEPKAVQVYASSQVPSMTFSAKVEKSGIVNIYAQTAGIVQSIRLQEGDRVQRGTNLLTLSTTYQGGNAASLSRQIAQKSYDFNAKNFELQKDIIAKQKELANQGNAQASELRSIGRQSLEDTRNLVTLNQDIIGQIDNQIEFLKLTNVGGVNDAALLGALQGKAAAQGGLVQLQSGLRAAEFQSSDSSVAAQLSNTSRDATIKQLELQENSLSLAKDISKLNLKLARISESMMYPAAPGAGMIERIHVNIGQSISPGTLLATIKADKGENTALVFVTREVANRVSLTEPSQILIGDMSMDLYPRYISSEATQGNLYLVMYDIPADSSELLTDTELLQIRIPVGSISVSDDKIMVPLDSVYQTQTQAYVTVLRQNDADQDIARTIEVELGQVSGSYVQVASGLSAQDQVIISRNVQDGDLVKVL